MNYLKGYFVADVKFKGPIFNKSEMARILSEAFKNIPGGEVKSLIVDQSILKGISPVEGEGRFESYSDSYKDAIDQGRYSKYSKKKLPVNLKLSGKMLDSFFVDTKEIKNKIVIGFEHYLAEIHSKLGAGKSKVIRKMLPLKKGEEFKTSIRNGIIKLVKNELSKILRK